MKISVQERQFVYSCDFSQLDCVRDGFLEEYYPTVQEALGAAVDLLGCVYPEDEIRECLMVLASEI